jgi:hypothetical protein
MEWEKGNGSCLLEMDRCSEVAWLCTAATRGSRVILSELMALPQGESRQYPVAFVRSCRDQLKVSTPSASLVENIQPPNEGLIAAAILETACYTTAQPDFPGCHGSAGTRKSRSRSKGGRATRLWTDVGMWKLKAECSAQPRSTAVVTAQCWSRQTHDVFSRAAPD